MLFGKTMENLRTRIDLELVTNPTRAKNLIARPTTLHWDIITENLVSIRKQKPKIIVDRSIYLGFCILELSKITMYKFHYEEFWASTNRVPNWRTLTPTLWYTTFKHPPCTKTWRTTWTRMTLPTIRSTTPSTRVLCKTKDECSS